MSLPAWANAFTPESITAVNSLPLGQPARDWAWEGATGKGVKVAVIDSGVDADHPWVGGIAGAVRVEIAADDPQRIDLVEGPHEDLVGHGTACAAIIRRLAPEVQIYSVRVLGSNLKGKSALFCAGIEWAIAAGMDVLNLSLSSRSEQWAGPLHDIADSAYFHGSVMVCAANNVPGPTFPSQFASVVSVAARAGVGEESITYNARPPVEFGARGVDVEVAWSGGTTITATGNSFATPHVAGMVARIMSKHPGLTPFQVKAALHALSENAAPTT